MNVQSSNLQDELRVKQSDLYERFYFISSHKQAVSIPDEIWSAVDACGISAADLSRNLLQDIPLK